MVTWNLCVRLMKYTNGCTRPIRDNVEVRNEHVIIAAPGEFFSRIPGLIVAAVSGN